MNDKFLSASPSDERSPATRTLQIVVADDDRDAVRTLMLLLRDEGHEVASVHTGKQALDAALRNEPDAVLIDIALPDMSGWDVARAIRARHGHGRPMLIGVSGQYKTGADRVLAEITGFDHYLVKPYDLSAMLALLAPLTLRGQRPG